MEPGSRRPGRGSAALPAAGHGAESDISVVIEAPGWRAAVPRVEQVARRAARVALTEAGHEGGAITVLLSDDRALKRLNGGFRGKAKPTNVLSFPAEHAARLGDIALAFGVVRREARQAGRSARAHLAHLVAHGALHLVGHDHIAAGDARRMEQAESRIMRRLGLRNPWRGAI